MSTEEVDPDELRVGLSSSEPPAAGGLASALAYAAQLAVDSAAPHVFRISTDPEAVWLATGKELRRVPQVAPHRSVALSSARELVAALRGRSITSSNDTEHRLAAVDSPEVYVHPQGIFAWLDRHKRLERATVALTCTPLWDQLQTLAMSPKVFTVSALQRFLRIECELDATHPAVAAFSRLDFKRAASSVQGRTSGSESLGRAVEEAVQGAQELPNEVVVPVFVWAAEQWQPQVQVRLRIWIDFEKAGVEVSVSRSELEAAGLHARQHLLELLIGAMPDVPVFGASEPPI